MRLADAQVGDRVVLRGTVIKVFTGGSTDNDHSEVRFDGIPSTGANYVSHTAEVETIERPWKVGDRYQVRYGRGFSEVLGEPCEVLAIEGDYVFHKNVKTGTCSVCKLEILTEATRLP